MCFDLMNDATKTRKTTKRVRAIFVISSQIEFIILSRAGFCLPHWLCCEKKIIAANGDVIPFIRFALIIALSPCSECLFNCLPSLTLKVPFLAAQPPAPLCPSLVLLCVGVFYRLTLQWSCAKKEGMGGGMRMEFHSCHTFFCLSLFFCHLSKS